MVRMFDQKKTNPETIRYLKKMIAERFQLSDTTIISIAELRCHEQGCPPIETVINIRDDSSIVRNFKILKSASDIKAIDIENLNNN